MVKYTVSADIHCHNWTAFARVNEDGVNSRLRYILNELERQAEVTKDNGCEYMIIAGDLFHVRGSIEPSVFNPTLETFTRISDMGVKVIIEPGNHDLEGSNTDKLGSAVQALGEIKNVTVIDKPEMFEVGDEYLYMIPWYEDLSKLRELLNKSPAPLRSNTHVFIHAPVNGVIKGLPDHGLEADELKAFGFARVWAGHYHNAVDFGEGVISIGASTHQTWGDPDSKAGFWLHRNGRDFHYETKAPLFVNIEEKFLEHEEDVINDHVRGNYCRIKLKETTKDKVEDIRKFLKAHGALGIVDHSSYRREVTRNGSVAKSGESTEATVGTYIDSAHETNLDKKKLTAKSLEILTRVRGKE